MKGASNKPELQQFASIKEIVDAQNTTEVQNEF